MKAFLEQYAGSRVKDAMLRSTAPLLLAVSRLKPLRVRRSLLAHYHLRGTGLEIGAMAAPTMLPPGVRVTYVDIQSAAAYKRNPEYAPFPVVDPDVIDDAESLGRFESESQDFVIASHVIEHLENPLAAIQTFFRVLRPQGKLILAIPDKRYTFDAPRDVTPFSHLVKDFEIGPESSRKEHYRENGRVFEGLEEGEALDRYVDRMMQERENLHFHVWDFDAFAELLFKARSVLGIPYDVVELVSSGRHEVIAVLQKIASAGAEG